MEFRKESYWKVSHSPFVVSYQDWRDVQDVRLALSGPQQSWLDAWFERKAIANIFGSWSKKLLERSMFECNRMHT